MINQVRNFTESPNFANAVKVTIAAVLPFFIFFRLDLFEIGFTVGLGALLTAPSDISSNLRHKINGILAAACIVAGSAFLISVSYQIPFLFYPMLFGTVFFLSMISVYGSRASAVSFSGLLSVSLVFSGFYQGLELLMHCGLMLAGGLFYLVISLAFYYIRPHRYAEYQLAECIRLTSKYLKLRGDLWNIDADRQKIIERQLQLQVELNTIHENIREALISTRSSAGTSSQNRKMLIVFISLLEILELALSTSFEHGKLREKFSDHQNVLRTYQKIAYDFGATLKKLAKKLERNQPYKPVHNLFEDLRAFEKAITEYAGSGDNESTTEGVYMLTTMLHYAEKQVESINLVERALTMAVFQHDLRGKDRDIEKFLTPQYYSFSIFRENLSFKSSAFRHSLRLALTILVGYLIGIFLPFQNVYWILLTIVVIMRPGYGLTKQRSYQRIIGTVVGGLIAFGILSAVRDPYAISAFAVVSMVLGLTFSHTDYKIGATFVTMYVVFLYGMLVPDIRDVVQYRILDTVTGAGLAFAANYLLWPMWEFLSVPVHLEKAIKSNRDYLREIANLYHKKSDVPVSYRLARKQAFIEIGNLMASFQRMAQEPKSKQKQLPKVYKLAEINHTLLSSLASLGTYIQTHQTTKASEAFDAVVAAAIKNLNDAVALLNGNEIIDKNDDLTRHFLEIRNSSARELDENNPDIQDKHMKMQESQLVVEQLIWLTTLTENILKTVKLLGKY